MRQMLNWGSKCELLKDSYNDWQHTETFVVGKLIQSVIFMYCAEAFLDIKNGIH